MDLAEVMNYPGVIEGDRSVLAKIAAFRGHPIDGHAPQVTRARPQCLCRRGHRHRT